MTNEKPERRNHRRRTVELPIAILNINNQKGRQGVFLGQVRDASASGIRVVTQKFFDFNPGDEFLLYALHQQGADFATAIEIRAKLVWQDKNKGVLGMKVLHGDDQ